MILLHKLPPDDPRRNLPMRDLAVQIRNKQSKLWRDLRTWKIGRATYNQCPAWHEYEEFRIP